MTVTQRQPTLPRNMCYSNWKQSSPLVGEMVDQPSRDDRRLIRKKKRSLKPDVHQLVVSITSRRKQGWPVGEPKYCRDGYEDCDYNKLSRHLNCSNWPGLKSSCDGSHFKLAEIFHSNIYPRTSTKFKVRTPPYLISPWMLAAN